MKNKEKERLIKLFDSLDIKKQKELNKKGLTFDLSKLSIERRQDYIVEEDFEVRNKLFLKNLDLYYDEVTDTIYRCFYKNVNNINFFYNNLIPPKIRKILMNEEYFEHRFYITYRMEKGNRTVNAYYFKDVFKAIEIYKNQKSIKYKKYKIENDKTVQRIFNRSVYMGLYSEYEKNTINSSMQININENIKRRSRL